MVFDFDNHDESAESVSLKTFTYYDRMIPMQDSLPEGKLGNLIALPLQGRALKNGNSAFVDESWMTYKDQWKRLRETRKLSEKEIDELIKLWCPDDDTMSIFQNDIEEESTGQAPLLFGQSPASRRNFHAEDADDVVKIYLSDGIYVNKTGLKDRMQNAIRRIAAYSNPQFFQILKLGFSTKDTPRIVYNGYDEGDYIIIPRGCYDELISQLSGAGVLYDVVDKRQKGRKIDVHFNGALYPEQQVAAEKMLYNDIGVLAAATAFGKTVLGAYLIAQKKVNALVLVHNVEIMNNWIKDLNSFLTINEELPTYTTPKGRVKKRSSLIGTFSSQKDATTGIIDIAMITSLGREDNINELVCNYGMVIVDECHHAAGSVVISSPSFSFKKVNWLCSESECLQLKGVSVVVLTLDPEDYPEDGRDQHKSHIEHLISAGVNVITRHKYRERFAIIDKSLVWYGSMTLLSNEKEDDSLMRISNPAIAEELLEFAVLQS